MVIKTDKNIGTAVLFIITDIYKWKLLDEFSICAYQIGQYKEAIEACERILENNILDHESDTRNGTTVAWFASFDENVVEWCRENYFGRWLTWQAYFPEMILLTEEQILEIEKKPRNLHLCLYLAIIQYEVCWIISLSIF
jgi:hypothetical protein